MSGQVSGVQTSLRAVVDVTVPLVLLFSLHLLFVGHDEPGGGFAAGLLAAGALAVDSIAHHDLPTRRIGARLPSPLALMGGGLTIATLIALAPMLAGDPMLESAKVEFAAGVFGKVKITTVLVFDLAVFAIVVGFVTVILDRVRQEVSL